MKVFIANLWFLIWGLTAFAQIENPVTWSFSAKDVGEGKAEINIKRDSAKPIVYFMFRVLLIVQ